jgi:hypothetical protein
MTKPNQEPGPGRSTSATAFDDLRKEIAKRNEQATEKAQKLRAARDRAQLIERRRWELL